MHRAGLRALAARPSLRAVGRAAWLDRNAVATSLSPCGSLVAPVRRVQTDETIARRPAATSSTRFARSTPSPVDGAVATRMSSRQYCLFLYTISNELRSRSGAVPRADALRRLHAISLHDVVGLSGRDVVQCLRTLATLGDVPDSPTVAQAASWLSVHGAGLNLESLVQALHALVLLRYKALAHVVTSVQDCLLRDLDTAPWHCRCLSLGVVLHALPGARQDSELWDLALRLRTALVESTGVRGGPTPPSLRTETVALLAGLNVAGQTLRASVPQRPHDDVAAWASLAREVWGAVTDSTAVAGLSVSDVLTLTQLTCGATACGGWLPETESVRARRDALCDVVVARVRTGSVHNLTHDALVALATLCLCGETAAALHPVWVEEVEPVVRVRLTRDGAGDVELAAEMLQLCVARHTSTDGPSRAEGEPNATALQLSQLVPAYVLTALSAAVEATTSENGTTVHWTPHVVSIVLRVLPRDPATHAYAVRVARLYLAQLQRQVRLRDGRTGSGLQPCEVMPLLQSELMHGAQPVLERAVVQQVTQLVATELEHWGVAEVLSFLETLAQLPLGKDDTATTILRGAALVLVTNVDKASGPQLAALMRCYGAAGVREETFCGAVVQRFQALLPELTIRDVVAILGGLTALECADVKPFIDAVGLVLNELPRMTSAQDVTLLLSAYAMQRVYDFRLYIALAERLVALAGSATVTQLLSGQTSLLRVSVQYDALTEALVERAWAVVRGTAVSEPALVPRCALQLLHVVSRVVGQTPLSAPPPSPDRVALCEALAEFATRDVAAADLPVGDVAEVLLGVARVHRWAHNGALFDTLALRAMGALPSATPDVLLSLLEAYALAGRTGGDAVELFTTVAERLIACKNVIPAAQLAAALAAFARVGVRHDHLFMEMIPRMRAIAVCGTPQDIANVVGAFAAAGVWHYHLFSRLAERALQVRLGFDKTLMLRVLEAYAAVGMRQTQLFDEFALDLVACVPTFSPDELVRVVEGYAAVEVAKAELLRRCAEHAARKLRDFTSSEAHRLLTAMQSLGFVAPPVLRAAYAELHPTVYVDVVGVGAHEDRDGDDKTGDDAGATLEVAAGDATQT